MDEPAGFRDFVLDRSAALVRSAYLLTGDLGEAEDLVQTALIKAWSRWERIEKAEAREAYVRRIVVSTFLSWRRRRWHAETPTEALPERVDRSDPFGSVDIRSVTVAALREIPPRQRAVLVLRYFDDLTEAQVALALGCSVGTVKSQSSKALSRLRTHESLRDSFTEEVRHGK